MSKKTSRRHALKAMGTALGGIGIVGTVGADSPSESPTEEPTTTDEPGGGASTQAIIDATARWVPQTIDSSDSTVLQGEWDVIVATGGTIHRFDAIIEADMVSRPTTVASAFAGNEIEKDWEYQSDSALPGGEPAYHFKAKAIMTTPGSTPYVDARVEPTTDGRITGMVGSYWDPVYSWNGEWVTAYCNVE